MKTKKLLPLLMILPLSSCGKALVIPTVDVTALEISLPDRPEYNTGAIRSDATYDYVDVYELSDFHGAVNEEKHSGGTYIGLPKLASYFEGKRATNPGGTVILSSGDMFQGSADSNLTRGYMVNYSMQYMGFDAMTLGNHEFDWTDEWIKNNSELKYNTSTIPYLGANILKNGEIPSFLHKSVVLQRGDYKIGVIGTIGNELEDTIIKSALEGYEFVEYKAIVDAEAARLKAEESCNAVILLSHEDAEKMEPVVGIDAAFGGHAHLDKQGNVGGATTLATKNYGQSVAHFELKFDKSTKALSGTTANIEPMVTVADSLKENASIKSIMDQYAPSIDKIKNIKLGKADSELKIDGSLINLCTKSMHEAAVEFAPSLNIDTSKIIASYHNVNGGIRSDIAKGKITYGNVYKSFPFDNEVVLIAVSGEEYKTKIHSLDILGLYRTFEKRSEIVDSETYYLVTTDFVALSDSYFGKFKTLEDKDLIRTGKVVRDEVAEKIYSVKKVKNSEWNSTETCFKNIPISF